MNRYNKEAAELSDATSINITPVADKHIFVANSLKAAIASAGLFDRLVGAVEN